MTNKEAITVLVEIREDYSGEGETLVNGREALNLAIKSLEDKDLRERMQKIYYQELRKEMKNEVNPLPECKECRTCTHCTKNKKLPKITWTDAYPFIYCTHHHEHFAPNDTCEFWKEHTYD